MRGMAGQRPEGVRVGTGTESIWEANDVTSRVTSSGLSTHKLPLEKLLWENSSRKEDGCIKAHASP